MKTLNTKQEVAKAINFGEYPVLKLDLADKIELGGQVCGYNGCKVRIRIPGKDYYRRAVLEYYIEDKKLVIREQSIMITNGMSYSELEEMVDYANAPIIEPNQEVVLVILNSKERIYYDPIILQINKNCRGVEGKIMFLG